MKKIFIAFLTITLCNLAMSLTNVYPKTKSFSSRKDADVEDPLILTPLIKKGEIDLARKKAEVRHQEMKDVSSYAGYLTVNKEYNSNLFFWFFKAQQTDPKNSPVVLWLQGGPGTSSAFGIFSENGPFSVTKNQTLKIREYSWNFNHNLLYIDNPVGTGYSFTENDLGYATNETNIGHNLLTALVQFFDLFPEMQPNEFYVIGESYAGKYVPAVSLAIKSYNANSKTKINLQGLAIGNGFLDPYYQFVYSDYLYQIGLLDFNGRDQFKKLEDKARSLIKQEKHEEAFEVFRKLIIHDPSKEPTLFKNLTGFDNWHNYLFNKKPDNTDYFSYWIQQSSVRKAIHVGNRTFSSHAKKVEEYLRGDVTKSVTPSTFNLLEHYKVLLYCGQLDIIVGYPMMENYLLNVEWPGANDYRNTPRKLWRVGKDLAGYSKTIGNLTEILVRNAGHTVIIDQPMWTWDLITRFTYHKDF